MEKIFIVATWSPASNQAPAKNICLDLKSYFSLCSSEWDLLLEIFWLFDKRTQQQGDFCGQMYGLQAAPNDFVFIHWALLIQNLWKMFLSVARSSHFYCTLTFILLFSVGKQNSVRWRTTHDFNKFYIKSRASSKFYEDQV